MSPRAAAAGDGRPPKDSHVIIHGRNNKQWKLLRGSCKPRSGGKMIAGGEAKRNPRSRSKGFQAPKGRQIGVLTLPPLRGLII